MLHVPAHGVRQEVAQVLRAAQLMMMVLAGFEGRRTRPFGDGKRHAERVDLLLGFEPDLSQLLLGLDALLDDGPANAYATNRRRSILKHGIVGLGWGGGHGTHLSRRWRSNTSDSRRCLNSWVCERLRLRSSLWVTDTFHSPMLVTLFKLAPAADTCTT